MLIILFNEERKIHNSILKVGTVSEILNKEKKFWVEQVKVTKKEFKKMQDTRGSRVPLSPREIVGLTMLKISYIADDFLNEIGKLEYKERVSDKITYKKLQKLGINIPGLGELDLGKKGLFIVLAKLSEDEVFNI